MRPDRMLPSVRAAEFVRCGRPGPLDSRGLPTAPSGAFRGTQAGGPGQASRAALQAPGWFWNHTDKRLTFVRYKALYQGGQESARRGLNGRRGLTMSDSAYVRRRRRRRRWRKSRRGPPDNYIADRYYQHAGIWTPLGNTHSYSAWLYQQAVSSPLGLRRHAGAS